MVEYNLFSSRLLFFIQRVMCANIFASFIKYSSHEQTLPGRSFKSVRPSAVIESRDGMSEAGGETGKF